MRLGISSYTFGWAVGAAGQAPARPLDEQGLLDKCRSHGMKLLQIGDNLPLHTLGKERLTKLSTRSQREGVQLEVGARRLTRERAEEYIEIARRLGAELVRFVIDDGDYHPSASEIGGVLREIAPLLEGIRLGIENHDRFTAATLREIVESSQSEMIGVCLDTANSLGAGEGIETVTETLGPFVFNLHIKDFTIERVPYLMGFNVSGRPAGAGRLDLPRVLDQLARHGRCKTAVLELWTPPEPELEQTIAKEAMWASESLSYLKPLFE